jgi:8-oxo-dGTP pyrophosphatase MutT (NUDIX family)
MAKPVDVLIRPKLYMFLVLWCLIDGLLEQVLLVANTPYYSGNLENWGLVGGSVDVRYCKFQSMTEGEQKRIVWLTAQRELMEELRVDCAPGSAIVDDILRTLESNANEIQMGPVHVSRCGSKSYVGLYMFVDVTSSFKSISERERGDVLTYADVKDAVRQWSAAIANAKKREVLGIDVFTQDEFQRLVDTRKLWITHCNVWEGLDALKPASFEHACLPRWMQRLCARGVPGIREWLRSRARARAHARP